MVVPNGGGFVGFVAEGVDDEFCVHEVLGRVAVEGVNDFVGVPVGAGHGGTGDGATFGDVVPASALEGGEPVGVGGDSQAAWADYLGGRVPGGVDVFGVDGGVKQVHLVVAGGAGGGGDPKIVKDGAAVFGVVHVVDVGAHGRLDLGVEVLQLVPVPRLDGPTLHQGCYWVDVVPNGIRTQF